MIEQAGLANQKHVSVVDERDLHMHSSTSPVFRVATADYIPQRLRLEQTEAW